MNCPKCNTKMYQELEECRQTYIGIGIRHLPELVYKCWNCATRCAVDQQPVRPVTADMLNALKRHSPRGSGLETVRQFYDSIVKMRRQKTAWATIAKLIQQATKSRIKPETIQRNFEQLKLQGVS